MKIREYRPRGSARHDASLLISSIADMFREIIVERAQPAPSLPKELQPRRLMRMCDKIEARACVWSSSRLHRWIGFVQCGMMANGMLDADEASSIFEKAEIAYGKQEADVQDHLDPSDWFELDMGGEG